MDWSDVLKLALSIFLILTGIGLAYLFLRMAGVFGRLGVSVTRITDEVVPILNKAQTTVDGVNLELARVDEIMQTAVGATKGAEKTVVTVSSAVTGAGAQAHRPRRGRSEAVATLARPARRRESGLRPAASAAAATPPIPPESPPVPPAAEQAAPPPPRRRLTPPPSTPATAAPTDAEARQAGDRGRGRRLARLDRRARPRLWTDTVKREKERIPAQIKEALAAGKRAAAQAEADLDREVKEAFERR